MSAFYSSLARHHQEFQLGWPILMYHKLGVPPPGTQLRGLYVSVPFFRKQLTEWSSTGARWRTLDEGPASSGLTITFDDGYSSVLRLGLEPLRQVGCRAIQFLISGLLGKSNLWDLSAGEVQEPIMDVVQVKEWLAAGHQIGAHTRSHPRLTQIPLAEAREEIHSSKRSLEDLFGVPVHHFAYPYGDWNERVQDLVREAGFVTASTCHVGVNGPNQSLFCLKRYMARHPSRKFFRPWTWF